MTKREFNPVMDLETLSFEEQLTKWNMFIPEIRKQNSLEVFLIALPRVERTEIFYMAPKCTTKANWYHLQALVRTSL